MVLRCNFGVDCLLPARDVATFLCAVLKIYIPITAIISCRLEKRGKGGGGKEERGGDKNCHDWLGKLGQCCSLSCL